MIKYKEMVPKEEVEKLLRNIYIGSPELLLRDIPVYEVNRVVIQTEVSNSILPDVKGSIERQMARDAGNFLYDHGLYECKVEDADSIIGKILGMSTITMRMCAIKKKEG